MGSHLNYISDCKIIIWVPGEGGVLISVSIEQLNLNTFFLVWVPQPMEKFFNLVKI